MQAAGDVVEQGERSEEAQRTQPVVAVATARRPCQRRAGRAYDSDCLKGASTAQCTYCAASFLEASNDSDSHGPFLPFEEQRIEENARGEG